MTLCHDRPRCEVKRRRAVRAPGNTPLEVVDLRIGHAPDTAGQDPDRCDRREYWLIGTGQPKLITLDCEEQWGADSQGPVDTTIDGVRMRIGYLEHQSSDGCEKDEIVVDLSNFAVEKHERWQGDAVQDRCTLTKPLPPREPPGDGSPAQPLVKLN